MASKIASKNCLQSALFRFHRSGQRVSPREGRDINNHRRAKSKENHCVSTCNFDAWMWVQGVGRTATDAASSLPQSGVTQRDANNQKTVRGVCPSEQTHVLRETGKPKTYATSPDHARGRRDNAREPTVGMAQWTILWPEKIQLSERGRRPEKKRVEQTLHSNM